MAFLIISPTGKKYLFDAGARKDYWNYSPMIRERFRKGVNVGGMRVTKGVAELLREGGVGVEEGEVEGVFWSHWHFDHIGDMSTFPSSTKIIVGPGFSDAMLPGYPANPDSPLLESDYVNHEMQELTFTTPLEIGGFRAIDYFADGSLYILDVPGHAIGHICALVRTTPDTFVLLGADACHFAGSLRPSVWVPLPESVTREELGEVQGGGCPCEDFLVSHPRGKEGRIKPWYSASRTPGSAYADWRVADRSVEKLRGFDACVDVLVCLAHDPGVGEVLPVFNGEGIKGGGIGKWKERGWKEKLRWRFLGELPRMVGGEGGKGRGWVRGREPIVEGWWRGGKRVGVEEALRRDGEE
ncbi:Metallo-hydrolase/oxidoreductase [Glarea lozoyensis ATCC 20868]|uniref:Metallo-hydrolase/oxidoreductase n=1 Tax=Glarea lozoyensis (strain ATCC 20868 / MF5171) TaxID=1116229 RepID=S3DFL3_GLAL2|nr:Metallo-hydrolase/oxidoreductase [Glarea lozoyensis ATCC 20868]EPE36545.1 Metallo-hydrolase/oxidoreductase [Glarea lozoyensis ATCC 20868]